MEKISRREAIKRTAAIMGCTLSGSLISAVLSGCSTNNSSSEWAPAALSQNQVNAAADLAEVILPATEIPGAKDANVERFIDSMVTGFLPPAEKEFILNALENLVQQNFSDLSFEQQGEFVSQMIYEEEGRNFFLMFKQMTLLGFFTSEIGATQVLQYDPIPGGYWGCDSLEELGGKTWAT